MEFTVQQKQELEKMARRHPDAHVRSRAMAVRAVSLGHSRQEVARYYPFSAYSIGQWCERFVNQGASAFEIAEGRGRTSSVDEKQVLDYLRRSPQQFGLEQTRWTLHGLKQACPTLAGLSERGILGVLHRLGFHYKQGQPWIHSPDPLYEEKKTPSKPHISKRAKTPRRSS